MPWFKVDDNLAFHHKVLAAGNPAIGLWVRAGSACAQQLTDGFVPDHLVSALGTRAQAQRLVAVGLWDRVEGGYAFHGWDERQPSKADVEAERAAAKERMRAHRERKRKASTKKSAQVSALRSPEQASNEHGTNGEVRAVFGDPDPTRPDPTTSSYGTSDAGEPAKSIRRARQLPDGWQPNENHRALAAERSVDLTVEVEKFRDWCASNGATKKDWDATFRNWLRNARPSAGPRRQGPARLPHPSQLELPPDGLSPEEYAAWDYEQRQRRAAR